LNPRALPFFVVAGVLGLLALALRFLPPARTAADPPAGRSVAAASPETLALPRLEPGQSLASLAAAFGPDVVPRRVRPSWRTDGEAWEWSEPAGRYAVAEFVGGGLAAATVRRPWTAWLPAVEADRLPALRVGESAAAIERAIGPGWPVARTIGAGEGGEIVTLAWSIRDRGVGTGAILRVSFQGGRAMVIQHPWAGR
jgi:hypothetical protein